MPRVSPCLSVPPGDRDKLESIARAHTSEQRHVLRARIVLACAKEHRIDELAKELGVSETTIAKWRDRYLEQGLTGLYDLPRKGRTVIYGEERKRALLRKLEETPPDGLARWDARTLSRELGMSVHAIWRILKKEGIYLSRKRS